MKVNNPTITPEKILNYIEETKPYKFFTPTREPYFKLLKEYGHLPGIINHKETICNLNPIQLKKLYNELKQLK